VVLDVEEVGRPDVRVTLLLPVTIESSAISAVTEESSGSAPVTISPEKEVNLPRTLLTIMCRTLKPTSECTGSMVQVPAM
jgi:hypothetical protein